MSTTPESAPIELLVRQIRAEAAGINAYELVEPDGRPLPPFSAGAHIDVHVASGLVRQYSLCNDPAERHRYVIAVLRDEGGRGGSRAVHERIRVRDRVAVSAPRNHFALAGGARKVVLLAGGIGVTPLKAMAHSLAADGASFELHYCAKAPDCAAFSEELSGLGGHVHYHFDGGNPANGLDITGMLAQPAAGTHLYYCGPGGFMKACGEASAHWPAGTVHCEHFKAPVAPTGAVVATGGYVAQIASTGQEVTVGAGQNLAEALQSAGIALETSCQSGLCGTCKVRYVSGEVDHQDYILDETERQSFLTPCVSRACGGRLVLDL
ncbi:iron-sulfur protein [Cupriavidus sp. TA19]|uniref:PDR/VanB family oxidoreductase n=1 Tax=unclassified Cupriavidus TaxID=2640874 RepID=UPI0027294179|nr:PDR/VanB family oxidoreductase [Cupriavidus sp. TA19]GLC93822.1 iron-sulfur protein [Cupriavidus sp. TA19]